MISSWPSMTKDLADIQIRTDGLATLTDIAEQAMSSIQSSTGAMTLRADDGVVVGIVGVIVTRPGCASAWALLSDSINAYPIETTHVIIDLCDGFAEEYDLRRMDMLCNADNNRNVRWAKILGFMLEGRLKHFGDDGQDLLIMARYWNG